MLGVNQLDFINYCNALKGNYRKGVHKMETLLENPTHAKEFAKNLGGVSVVLGTPVGKEDRNSETLRSMLLASDVANDAVYTWMGQYYEFDSWDDLMGNAERCKEMMANELLACAVRQRRGDGQDRGDARGPVLQRVCRHGRGRCIFYRYDSCD